MKINITASKLEAAALKNQRDSVAAEKKRVAKFLEQLEADYSASVLDFVTDIADREGVAPPTSVDAIDWSELESTRGLSYEVGEPAAVAQPVEATAD